MLSAPQRVIMMLALGILIGWVGAIFLRPARCARSRPIDAFEIANANSYLMPLTNEAAMTPNKACSQLLPTRVEYKTAI